MSDADCQHDYLTVEVDGTRRCCDCWGVIALGVADE